MKNAHAVFLRDGACAMRKRPTPLMLRSKWEGRILTEEHGENGFWLRSCSLARRR
ncbi:hypothetical protein O9993_23140 [Vibrio lentus]|nr:hypothetical protein [Vibrio lentus]